MVWIWQANGPHMCIYTYIYIYNIYIYINSWLRESELLLFLQGSNGAGPFFCQMDRKIKTRKPQYLGFNKIQKPSNFWQQMEKKEKKGVIIVAYAWENYFKTTLDFPLYQNKIGFLFGTVKI